MKLTVAEKLLGTDIYRNPFRNGRFANDRCFCGSSKKLKKCHGKEDFMTTSEHKKAMELFKKWEDSPAGQKYYYQLQQAEQ